MDGRIVAILVALVLPGILIGVTVLQFGGNPLAILGCLTVMIGGVLYLLTYTDSL